MLFALGVCLPAPPGSAFQDGPAASPPTATSEQPATGPVWLRELTALPASGGAADADQLFLPLDSGELISLRRETGDVAWIAQLPTRWPPYLRNGSLLVASDAAILEIDPATGSERGAMTLPAPPSAPIAAFGRGIAVPLTSGEVAAFDAEGVPLWTTTTGAVSHVPAATEGADVVYVALSSGRLVALRGDDGLVLWTREIGGALSAPAARDGRVYVGSTTRAVYAFDGASGRLLWEFPTGGDVVGVSTDDASLFVVALDNVVRALHLSRGSLKWKRVPPTRPTSAPVRSGSHLFIGGVRPQLLAFDARTGEPVTSIALPDQLELAMLAVAPIVFPEAADANVSVALVTRDTRILGVALDPPRSGPPSPVDPAPAEPAAQP